MNPADGRPWALYDTRMRFLIFLGVLILFLPNCKQKKITLNIQTNGQLTLIDSSEITENLVSYSVMQNDGIYPIHYIGENSDTINLRKREIPRFGYGEKEYGNHIRIPDSSRMTIFVDTLFDLTNTAYYEHYHLDSEKVVTDSIVNYKAYPVLIRNISDSLLYVGDCWDRINVVRQVKTKKGYWRDIEIPARYWCATGCRPIIMEPNQILISKMMRFRGDSKVECRLKYTAWKYTIYSNTFFDHLNQKQFQEPM